MTKTLAMTETQTVTETQAMRATRRPIRLSPAALLIGIPMLSIVGCGTVPQDRYDALLTANRSMEEQLVALEDERDGARENVRTLQGQLAQLRSAFDDVQSRYDQLARGFRDATADNEAYLRRIASLEVGPLPPEVEEAIMALARQHPDVFTFDAKQGMLRFASDFTFDLGSVELRSDAQRTLTQLAQILNTAKARDLEVRIVGHTDNVPIGRPETRRNHPTNLHLSVHRSISVRDALVTAGCAADRIQVAGYGEFRPVVQNQGQSGATANRRVEVYLAPRTDGGVRAPAVATPEPRVAAPASVARPEPRK